MVERVTGRKRRTLQKDRCLGRGFPYYKIGRNVVYDLQEVRRLIRSGRKPQRSYDHLIAGTREIAEKATDPRTRALAEELLSREAAATIESSVEVDAR